MAFNGTLILLFSGALPLISLHFIGVFSLSLFDLYPELGFGLSTSESPSEWTEFFSSVEAGLILIAILFPITLVAGFASLRFGPKACLVAGFLGMICWLGSLFAIVLLKLSIAQSGGPLGGLGANFIQIGYGVYGGILGSAILLISYFVAKRELDRLAGSPASAELDSSNACLPKPLLSLRYFHCNVMDIPMKTPQATLILIQF